MKETSDFTVGHSISGNKLNATSSKEESPVPDFIGIEGALDLEINDTAWGLQNPPVPDSVPMDELTELDRMAHWEGPLQLQSRRESAAEQGQHSDGNEEPSGAKSSRHLPHPEPNPSAPSTWKQKTKRDNQSAYRVEGEQVGEWEQGFLWIGTDSEGTRGSGGNNRSF